MSAAARTYTPLWPFLESRIVAAQPSGQLPKPNGNGWIGCIFSPLRQEDRPSFSVKPDSETDPGGFEDHGTGDKGPISKLAQLMNVDPHVSSSPTDAQPQTFATFCATRKLDPDILTKVWGVRQVQWHDKRAQRTRPALRYPTALGIDRIKYLDKGPKLDKYIWAGQGGHRHWYGLDTALQMSGPLYLVNGEPSVWAAQQEGVAAICLCGGEGAAPTPELVASLVAAGITELRVVYDLDDKGRAGAPKTVAAHQAGAIDATAYELPSFLGAGGDVDDLHRWAGAGLADALAALPPLVATVIPDAPTPAPARKLLHVSELHTLPKAEDIIPGVLSRNKLNLIFGLPGAGKSLVNLDMALSVSQFAPVVYLAGEDAEEYMPRVKAWEEHHGVAAGHLYFWPEPVNLLDPDSVSMFLAEVAPINPDLIVVDTLATCMTGADENSTKEMGLAIEALHYVRRQTRAGLLLCHHTGWADNHERGSSALRGAVRIAMKVAQSDDGLISVTCEKSNNASAFEPRYFRLIPKAESVALIPSSKLIGANGPLKQKHFDILEALDLSIFAHGASFTQLVEHTGLQKSGVNRAISKLIERDFIASSGGRNKLYTLTATGKADLQAYLFQAAGPSSTQVPSQFRNSVELALNWAVNLPEDQEASSTQVPPSSTKFHPSSTPVSLSIPDSSEFRSSSPPYKGGTWNSEPVEQGQERPTSPATSLQVLDLTDDWQEVLTGVALPPGADIRMDMETGKNYARKLPPKESDLSHDKKREAEAETFLAHGDIKAARRAAGHIRGNVERQRVLDRIDDIAAEVRS